MNFDDLLILAKNYNHVIGQSVRIAGPAEGSHVVGGATFVADPSSTVGLAGVQFMVNGQPVGPEDTTAPYTLTWDSTAVLNGDYQVTAVAQRGRESTATTSEPVGFRVDNPDLTPPAVTITGPAEDAPVGGTVVLTADASDTSAWSACSSSVDGATVGGGHGRALRVLLGFEGGRRRPRRGRPGARRGGKRHDFRGRW